MHIRLTATGQKNERLDKMKTLNDCQFSQKIQQQNNQRRPVSHLIKAVLYCMWKSSKRKRIRCSGEHPCWKGLHCYSYIDIAQRKSSVECILWSRNKWVSSSILKIVLCSSVEQVKQLTESEKHLKTLHFKVPKNEKRSNRSEVEVKSVNEWPGRPCIKTPPHMKIDVSVV